MNNQQKSDFSRAVKAQQKGDLATALATYTNLYQSGIREANLLHLYGVALHQNGNHKPASKLIEQALEIEPDSISILANLAVVYKALGEIAPCIEQYKKIVQLEPNHLEALQSLVFHLRSIRQHEEAISFARRALAINPKHDLTHNNLGNIYSDIGDLENARKHYTQATQINPHNGQAWANLATSKKYQQSDQAEIDFMINVLNSDQITQTNASQLNFAIGKAYKDLDNADTAFPYYQKHHELLPSTQFPWEPFESYLANIRNTYTKEYFAEIKPIDRTTSPIFIVGMLRSGTSLLERILAAHSQFSGIGERPEIAMLTQKIPNYPKAMVKVANQTFEVLSDEYLHLIEPHYNSGQHRSVDKMMTNFMHIGFIYRLFPNAKIIHTQRNPYAVCLSCYLQNFAQPPAWAQTLDSIGRYYSNYQQMVSFWSDHFPGSLIDVTYENLLSSPETEIKRILSFCDAPWQQACLEFHRSKGVVKTASNWQVRQPLDQHNAEKWRAFESHLGDLDKWLSD